MNYPNPWKMLPEFDGVMVSAKVYKLLSEMNKPDVLIIQILENLDGINRCFDLIYTTERWVTIKDANNEDVLILKTAYEALNRMNMDDISICATLRAIDSVTDDQCGKFVQGNIKKTSAKIRVQNRAKVLSGVKKKIQAKIIEEK